MSDRLVDRGTAPIVPPAVDALRQPATIRERCAAVTRAASESRSPHFLIDRSRLEVAARRVERVMRSRFPTLRVPYHSRWRHFEAGGIDRPGELDALLQDASPAERARARFDVTVLSVLLDAGAGPGWSYREAETGQSWARSEGLGVATFRAFTRGWFSNVPGEPWRVDAAVLQNIDADVLARVFQAGDGNPLIGLAGRATLLRRLGEALRKLAALHGGDARPGALYDALTAHGQRHELPAAAVLRALLDNFSDIWPSGQHLNGVTLGDAWLHPRAGGTGPGAGWVPFHKLSQWLAYSLLEPLEWAGIRVTGLDALTGLPEYRNGGLLIDSGVIVPRDARCYGRQWAVGDEFIVEWRALTVSLIDELAAIVRAQLGVDARQLPLACILEGGTWAAGRQVAAELREGGGPPLRVTSDGTVF